MASKTLRSKKTPRKFALVGVSNPLLWASCKSISENLRSAYNAALGSQVKFFEYNATMGIMDIWKLAIDLKAYGPERVVFVDHIPHPYRAIKAIQKVYGMRARPELAFHIYGDFSLYAKEWTNLGRFLSSSRMSCVFYCASERQVRFFTNCLVQAHLTRVELLPFPINVRRFQYSPATRQSWRKKLGFKVTDRVFLYTGRVSLQKNLLLAVDEFAQLAKVDPRVHFLIAGSADDLDAQLFGVNLPTGSYGLEVIQRLKSLPPDLRKRIRWIGSVDRDDIRGIYSASDFFVSFSLHHDEDYGMSVAEALVSGMQCCLTDWGGYSSFIDTEEDGALVPVGLSTTGLRIDRNRLQKTIQSMANLEDPSLGREDRALRNRERFSVSTCADTLLAQLENEALPFRGFSHNLGALSFQQHAGSGVPFPTGPCKGEFYGDIYGPYLKPQN